MKVINWIKLLSVLLCVVLLFAACSPAEDAGDGTDTTTDAVGTEATDSTESADQSGEAQPVDPVLKNFFTLNGTVTWKELKNATRLEGECVSSAGDLLVFRNAKIDTMNKVNETFTVYNAARQKVVLTLEHSYDYNENYAPFDFDDAEKLRDIDKQYPASVMEVEARFYGGYNLSGTYDGISFIQVSNATITPVDETVWEENDEEGNSHVVETTYDYYDACGTKMVQTTENRVAYLNDRTIRFGNSAVTFNEEQEMISMVNSDNQVIRSGFDAETDAYGVYLNQRQTSAWNTYKPFLEVYDKKDSSCVLRYYLNDCDQSLAYMLENGDILVQEICLVTEEGLPYDVEISTGLPIGGGSGIQRLAVKSYIVKIPSGEITEIELDGVLMFLGDRERVSETMMGQITGVELTEHVTNLGILIPFENKTLVQEPRVVVLNNEGSVIFELDRLAPEQYIPMKDLMNGGGGNSQNLFGFVVLPSGDYLVELDDELTHLSQDTQAIVSADMKVRSYLPTDAEVVGNYVVTDVGIFDYDLNLLCEFDEFDLTLEFTIGDKIVASREISGPDGITYEYFEVFKGEQTFETVQIFHDMQISVERLERDYVILMDSESGKYVMYNATLAHVLTSDQSISVYEFEEYYMLSTSVFDPARSEYVDIYYTVES